MLWNFRIMATPPAKTLTATGPVIIIILVIAAALLGYYQIVYYPTVAPTSTTQTVVPPTKLNVTVTIPSGAGSSGKPTSFYYQPNVITVVAGYNSTVIWRNNDSSVHTVTAALNSPDPRFNSFGPTSQPWNNVEANSIVNFTFTTPGTYNYSCSYHPWMHGEVKVLAAAPGSSTTASSTSSAAAAILSEFHFSLNPAIDFARSLAIRIGSGTEPWRVNLSSNLFDAFGLIPAVLTKIS
jgi:plastocyanin